MYCTKCGAAVLENAAFCTGCGQPIAAAQISAADAYQPQAAGMTPAYSGVSSAAAIPPAFVAAAAVPGLSPYAGFWLRAVAYLIDSLILTVVFGVFALIALAFIGLGTFESALRNTDNPQNIFVPVIVAAILLLALVSVVASCIYYAWMESSIHQGTLGKLALGLYVTDLQGRRLSFGRASGRFFAKFITGLIPLFIGYILAGITEKKQALHDMIASCLVLRKS